MKKTHELPNGVTLEIGKKYGSEKWEGYIHIDYLGDYVFVYTTGGDGKKPVENAINYNHAKDKWNLQPYTEPE
jgi:hypothetical protein